MSITQILTLTDWFLWSIVKSAHSSHPLPFRPSIHLGACPSVRPVYPSVHLPVSLFCHLHWRLYKNIAQRTSIKDASPIQKRVAVLQNPINLFKKLKRVDRLLLPAAPASYHPPLAYFYFYCYSCTRLWHNSTWLLLHTLRRSPCRAPIGNLRTGYPHSVGLEATSIAAVLAVVFAGNKTDNDLV